jgi:hypothetical protein
LAQILARHLPARHQNAPQPRIEEQKALGFPRKKGKT